jgi:ketosteroid isomerase-like protein
MTSEPEDTMTRDIVQAYYDILKTGAAAFDQAALRAILVPDLLFEGPIAGRRVGAEGFVQGVSGFVAVARNLTPVQEVISADEAAVLYDADLPGGTLRFAEFFAVTDGRIQSLRLLFDAAQYRALGGR